MRLVLLRLFLLMLHPRVLYCILEYRNKNRLHSMEVAASLAVLTSLVALTSLAAKPPRLLYGMTQWTLPQYPFILL